MCSFFLSFSKPSIFFKISFSNSCKNELWMVRSRIPTFLMHFSFQTQFSIQKPFNYELWMLDLGFQLFSSPFPFTVLFSKTCKTELRMVDLGFLLFSSRVPLKVSLQKPAISTLDGKILHSYFSNAIFLLKFDFKKLQEWTLDGQMWRKGQGAPQIHA